MVFLTGDTHSEVERLSSKNFSQGQKLTEKDFVIILGDFGLFWENTPDRREEYWIKWLSEKPWTTLFLDGNHENFFRLDNLPEVERFGGKVGFVNDKLLHLKRGEIYNIDNIKLFVFGGGYSIDKVRRVENISWWARELPSYMEYRNGLNNLEAHNFEVDFILSHEAPSSVYDIIKEKYFTEKNKYYDLPKFLEEVKNLTTFKHWFFGHFHFNESFGEDFTCLYKSIIQLSKELI